MLQIMLFLDQNRQRLLILMERHRLPDTLAKKWVRASNGRWAKLSTATPPQEFDLPLADGIIALQPCIYWKNQFEEVTIYGCTYGEVTEGDTIATLPEGFRPDHPVEWPASFTGDAGRVSGTVFISESGIVSIHTTAPAMSVVFAASFLAAG